MEHAVQSKTLQSDTLATRARRAKFYNNIHNIFTVPCEKSKMVSFVSSIMTNILFAPSRFPVKLICCITLGSALGLFT